tara:strand:- start:5370 stop:5774 length:405 start_codon:yes stop_codon:yes gene_type:complete
MGVLRAQLVVQSSDILSSVLNIGYNSSVEADSGVLMKAKVLKTSAHNDALTIYKANDKTTQAYVFVRNMNSEREKYIYVYNDTDSDAAVAKLGGGEFAFLPVHTDKTLKVYGTDVDQIVEYGVFGLDSSAVTLS